MRYLEETKKELLEAQYVLDEFINKTENLQNIELAALEIAGAFKKGNKVFSCGNGGSHCDAMHFAEELTGRYRHDRPAFPAIAISDPSHISCVSNDFGYDHIFSRYLEGLGNAGDVLLGISTSGHSKNIIKAAQTARNLSMKVIALTGNDGGGLADQADIEIRVPHFRYADRIQEIHIKIIHILILLIEKITEE